MSGRKLVLKVGWICSTPSPNCLQKKIFQIGENIWEQTIKWESKQDLNLKRLLLVLRSTTNIDFSIEQKSQKRDCVGPS